MSVLIKDMVMPTGCYDCPFRADVNLGVGIADGCNAIKAMISNPAERLPDCPLVPVSPHGRLIDADEFLKRAIGTKCFRGDYALMLEELVGESTTIIPASEEGE